MPSRADTTSGASVLRAGRPIRATRASECSACASNRPSNHPCNRPSNHPSNHPRNQPSTSPLLSVCYTLCSVAVLPCFQGDEEEVDRFQKTLDMREKGMIYVKGILN